jgi:E3 ubiquitin-protein ligase synoviolin
MFYGLPIHIMRDLFLTARSFAKRLTAFFRYRRATYDMNARYEDATVEDLQREDTCIICREEMRPWQPPVDPAQPAAPRPGSTVNERSRPKKLPCGHVIHLGCLKSWLERQQVCPTCRRPVVDGPQGQNPPGAANNANPAVQGNQPQNPGQQDGQGAQAQAGDRAPNRGMRMLNLGPLRVGFGQANLQDLAQNLGAQPGQQNAAIGGGARIYGLELGFPRRNQLRPQAAANPPIAGAHSLQEHLHDIEQEIVAEMRNLQITQQELQLVQLLQAELARLRLVQNGGADPLAPNLQMPPMPQLGPLGGRHTMPSTITVPQMQRHGVRQNTTAIPAGSADLPPGVVIPEGWSLLPLQRLDGPSGVSHVASGPAATVGLAPTATTQTVISPTNVGGTEDSNNTLTTPTPTINPDGHSQASSVASSDTNAIHTPPSVNADQSSASIPDTTLQSSTTASGATDSTLHENSNPLPDWGAPQLFPGPSRASASLSHNTGQNSAPPLSSSVEQLPINAGPSTTSNNVPAALNNNNEEEEQRKEKGKAKAVTVEDTEDEADGA